MDKSKSSGFSLIELLIVLSIIGVLMGIAGFNYMRSIRSAELREAAFQVAGELRRARSIAQRQSKDVTLTLPNKIESSNYTVQIGEGTTASVQNKMLDKKVTIKCGSGCNATTSNDMVKYQAPYGELTAIGKVFQVKSPMNGITPLEVRVVGVTGKVIVTQGTP